MDGVAALPLGCRGISNKRKRTCSGPAAHDGFIYYSYDLLSHDDDEAPAFSKTAAAWKATFTSGFVWSTRAPIVNKSSPASLAISSVLYYVPDRCDDKT